jgi:hypothetical protein
MSKIATVVVSLIIGFLVGVVVDEKLVHNNILPSQPTPASISGAASEPGAPMAVSPSFVGHWVYPNDGVKLTINADGTAYTPAILYWKEAQLRWHEEGNRIVFDDWVQKMPLFGFREGHMDPSKTYLTLDHGGCTPISIVREKQ